MNKKLIAAGILMAILLVGCGKDKVAETFEKETPAMTIVSRTDNKDKTVGILKVKAKNADLEKLRKTIDNGQRIYYIWNNHIFFDSNIDLINEYNYLVEHKQEVTAKKIVEARDAIKSADIDKIKMDMAFCYDKIEIYLDTGIEDVQKEIDKFNGYADRYNVYFRNLYQHAPAYYRKLAAKKKNNEILPMVKLSLENGKLVKTAQEGFDAKPTTKVLAKYRKHEIEITDGDNGTKKIGYVIYWDLNLENDVKNVTFDIKILDDSGKIVQQNNGTLNVTKWKKDTTEVKTYWGIFKNIKPEEAEQLKAKLQKEAKIQARIAKIVYIDGRETKL